MENREFTVKGHILDVVGRRQFDGEISVNAGKIAQVREADVPEGAPYILPGFVDSHIHIESTLLTPQNYAALAVSRGVVAVVTDPHEIANVTGMEGVDFMVDNGKRVRFHFNFGAPSCVPCTPFETAGAVFGHEEIARMLSREEFCCVAEFMNAPGVLFKDPECLAKIAAAKAAGKPVDGHAPGLDADKVKEYAAAGISTDHECVSLEEGRDRLAAGMYVLIREGSAANDFEALSPLLAEDTGKLMFCSDDKIPAELVRGYIDSMVSRSVGKGYPLWNVLDAACAAPVRHYGLSHGLLQEGDGADFILVDDLRDFKVQATYIDGYEVYGSGKLCRDDFDIDSSPISSYPNKFSAEEISVEDIRLAPLTGSMKVMEATDLSLRTGTRYVSPKVVDGNVVADVEADVLKLVVYNRYQKAAPQVAFISGFGLRKGAMAASIAHDSHNIVALGTDDAQIVRAVNAIVSMRGGIAFSDEEGITELPLPIAGLMSDKDGAAVAEIYGRLLDKAWSSGCTFSAPYMTMSFMCLPVIPEVKLSDKGLFDADRFAFTELFEK